MDAAFQSRLGYAFNDKARLLTALTHPSYAQENPAAPNNQRLEFLGDAVLDLWLAETLCRAYPDAREGFLSDARAALANAASRAVLAGEIGIPAHVRLAAHEEKNGARERENLRADAFEAVVGAIFDDGGYEAAAAFLARVFGALPERLAGLRHLHNPKGALQERFAGKPEYPKIEYILVKTEGPDHARRFTVEARAGITVLGRAEGASRRRAELAAATEALARLENARP